MRRTLRFIIWIIIAVMVAYIAYLYYQERDTAPPKTKTEPTVSETMIISDFRSMKNIEVPVEPVLGGTFGTYELVFPADFKGHEGETFWAHIEDGHILVSVKYRIVEVTDDTPARAVYEPVEYKMNEEYLPEGEYVVKAIGNQSLNQAD